MPLSNAQFFPFSWIYQDEKERLVLLPWKWKAQNPLEDFADSGSLASGSYKALIQESLFEYIKYASLLRKTCLCSMTALQVPF